MLSLDIATNLMKFVILGVKLWAGLLVALILIALAIALVGWVRDKPL